MPLVFGEFPYSTGGCRNRVTNRVVYVRHALTIISRAYAENLYWVI